MLIGGHDLPFCTVSECSTRIVLKTNWGQYCLICRAWENFLVDKGWAFWDTSEKDKGSKGITVEALTGTVEGGLKAKEINRDIASFSGSPRWHVYILTTTSLTHKSFWEFRFHFELALLAWWRQSCCENPSGIHGRIAVGRERFAAIVGPKLT